MFINKVFVDGYNFSIKGWRFSNWVNNNIQIWFRGNAKQNGTERLKRKAYAKQSNETKACIARHQKVDLNPKIFDKQKGYFI